MQAEVAPTWHQRFALPVYAAIAGPIVAIAVVWLPLMLHYRVDSPALSASVVEELRRVPSDRVLELLYQIGYVKTALYGVETNVIAAANEILSGTYLTVAGDRVVSDIGASPEMLTRMAPAAQFEMSGLAVSQVLLEAHRQTSDPKYLKSSLESALAWARLAGTTLFPTGYLWNDHAVASRVVVLAELWRHYRMHSSYDPVTAKELLEFAAQSAAMLSTDSHYTMRTNHGVMQNLAMLHFAAAFPAIPGNQEMIAQAIRRLESHWPYYVTEQGIVLEHSAGYLDFAIRLLHSSLGYLDVLNLQVPAPLERRLEAALCFRRNITRPDGSIPVHGDTLGPSPASRIATLAAGASCDSAADSWIDYEFGYASMHEFAGDGSQLFVTWANFPGRAHKHDDELALWMWKGGVDWWGASGYWPYGDATRDEAVSWRGANAPHAVGESAGMDSTSRLFGLVDGRPIKFLDLERRSREDGTFRRQVIGIAGAGVLVLDSSAEHSVEGRFESIWTLEPGVTLRQRNSRDDVFEFATQDGKHVLRVRSAGGERFSAGIAEPSPSPFAGLVARDRRILPTVSLVVTSDFGSWSLLHWQDMPGSDAAVSTPWQVVWVDAENWSIPVVEESGTRVLTRNGLQMTLHDVNGREQTFAIEPKVGSRPEYDRVASLYLSNSIRFPVFRAQLEYRLRASLGIGCLFAVQWVGLWFLGRLGMGNGLRTAATASSWLACSVWLYFQYLD